MKFRRLLAGLCLLWSVSATGQLTGQFYLEKASFARWEPVFLYYRLTNSGPASVTVASTLDPEQPGCSGHSITVSSDPVPTPSCPLLGAQGCNDNGPPSRPLLLRPGESYIERFLLNFDHEIYAPGEYWVAAKHSSLGNPTIRDVHTKLNFRVEQNTIPPSELQPWLDGLKSADREKRMEAARDFHTEQTNDLFYAKIREIYGVDVSDIESARLWAIFERIEKSEQSTWRQPST